MGWTTRKAYTKECGCECEDIENDVDRPFMCYTEYETVTTSRCSVHQQEYEQHCAVRQAEREREQQVREEQRHKLKLHLHMLTTIEHTEYAPIKEAVYKYREIKRISNSDRWIQQDIRYQIGDLLMIQKIKNKWLCSKDRLESCDFSLIFDFQRYEINEILKCFTNHKISNQLNTTDDDNNHILIPPISTT